MAMSMHVPTPADVAPDHHRTEEHEQRRNHQLGGRPQSLGHPNPKDDYEEDENAYRGGVSQSPDQPEAGCSPQAGSWPCSECRDGRKMVWLKGMAQPQQATHGQNGYNRRRHSEAEI